MGKVEKISFFIKHIRITSFRRLLSPFPSTNHLCFKINSKYQNLLARNAESTNCQEQ